MRRAIEIAKAANRCMARPRSRLLTQACLPAAIYPTKDVARNGGGGPRAYCNWAHPIRRFKCVRAIIGSAFLRRLFTAVGPRSRTYRALLKQKSLAAQSFEITLSVNYRPATVCVGGASRRWGVDDMKRAIVVLLVYCTRRLQEKVSKP